jgi:hypothetical protein
MWVQVYSSVTQRCTHKVIGQYNIMFSAAVTVQSKLEPCVCWEHFASAGGFGNVVVEDKSSNRSVRG